MSTAASPPPVPAASSDSSSERVILVSYPKIVFLWPSFLLSIVAGIYMHMAAGSATEVTSAGQGAVVMGWTFLIMLSLNLVVLSFDFPRTTSLTLFFVVVAILLSGALLIVYFPNFLPGLSRMLSALQPEANATFYYIFAGVMGMIYLFVAINRRFDYWEVRPNELLHHHGLLSDLKRYPTPQLRLDKEINDIFEFILLGSGRLILHFSDERRSIVLENVPWISRKEAAITKLLGALQVQVRND